MENLVFHQLLKLAGEHNVDLDLVEGTSKRRITRKDILKLVESGNIPQAGAAKKEEAVAAVVKRVRKHQKQRQ